MSGQGHAVSLINQSQGELISVLEITLYVYGMVARSHLESIFLLVLKVVDEDIAKMRKAIFLTSFYSFTH